MHACMHGWYRQMQRAKKKMLGHPAKKLNLAKLLQQSIVIQQDAALSKYMPAHISGGLLYFYCLLHNRCNER